MIHVRVADYEADRDALMAVRFAVFVSEQHVPADIEVDAEDPACVHVLACDDAEPVGTARIDFAAGGKIGRLAVLAAQRRRGIGSALMDFVHRLAERRGLARVWCHAQVAAVPFYERLGYRATGPRFVEAGIDHVKMEREL
jgi:predicted GNAT family N-acyltransferase